MPPSHPGGRRPGRGLGRGNVAHLQARAGCAARVARASPFRRHFHSTMLTPANSSHRASRHNKDSHRVRALHFGSRRHIGYVDDPVSCAKWTEDIARFTGDFLRGRRPIGERCDLSGREPFGHAFRRFGFVIGRGINFCPLWGIGFRRLPDLARCAGKCGGARYENVQVGVHWFGGIGRCKRCCRSFPDISALNPV
jgi:hypothetical protein